MIVRSFAIVDEYGLHAVPAQRLAKLVGEVDFGVFVEDEAGLRFSADNLLQLMSLKLHQGGHLRVLLDTPDAGEAEIFFEEVHSILLPKTPR